VADHRLLCRIRSYMVFVARCYALSRPWRHAVSACLSVCPSVRPSRSCILSKRVNISSNFFSPWRSHTIVVFSYQSLWQYSDGDPPPQRGHRMQVGYEKIITIFSIFNQCVASSRVVNGVTVRYYKQSVAGSWQVGDTHRRSLCRALEWGARCRITMAICCCGR